MENKNGRKTGSIIKITNLNLFFLPFFLEFNIFYQKERMPFHFSLENQKMEEWKNGRMEEWKSFQLYGMAVLHLLLEQKKGTWNFLRSLQLGCK